MRRMLLTAALSAIFLGILAVLTPSQALAQDGLKPGFRDMEWNQPPAPGMVKDHVEGNIIFYTRATDKLSIGNAKLTSIIYGFFNNRLSGVTVRTGVGQEDALLAVLNESWGKGHQSNPYIKSWIWSKGDTLAGYTINEFKHLGSMSIFNTTTYEEIKAADAAIAAKGKKDL